MKKLSGFFLVALLATACADEGKAPGEDSVQDTPREGEMTVQIPRSSCYMGVLKNDTFRLKVEKFPNVATGTLSYRFSEKDSNEGELDGVMRGDTLVADYSFLSEGKRSVRQVVFLVHENEAVEGYGDMEEKDGKMVFKSPGRLDFTSGVRLQKVSCVEQ